MRFKLQHSSKFKEGGYKVAHFWNCALLFTFPILIIALVVWLSICYLLMLLEQAVAAMPIFAGIVNWLFRNALYIIAIVALVVDIVTIWKTSIYYVEIKSKGIYLHHGNFVHYGLRQFPTINTIVPFKNIVSYKIGIPVDCPPNFRYTYYNHIYLLKRYFDMKRGKEVEYMKEPALAGGRYDEECVLLELDNKRIIVIPIDECEEFVELLDKYLQQYRELERQREKRKK